MVWLGYDKQVKETIGKRKRLSYGLGVSEAAGHGQQTLPFLSAHGTGGGGWGLLTSLYLGSRGEPILVNFEPLFFLLVPSL